MKMLIARGFTLLELLLSLFLSILLLSVVTLIYCAEEKTFQRYQASNQVQDNMRLFSQILSRIIHQAEYKSCRQLLETGLVGTDTSFMVRQISPYNDYLLANMHQRSQLQTTAVERWTAGDILFITDCQQSESAMVVAVQRISPQIQILTLSKPLQKNYAKNSEIRKIQLIHYFIDQSSGLPGFYQQESQHNKIQLIEGISEMNIRYVFNENHRIVEKSASAVEDWSQVKAISVRYVLTTGQGIHKTGYQFVALSG